jgi:tetratricopeptide (TPR) repeat protein
LAERHYRVALEIDPDFAAVANNMAFILVDQGKKLNEDLDLARLAKEKLPNNPYVMDTLGWVYYKKGLYDPAIGAFSDNLENLPENATVTYHLGRTYYKKVDFDRARTELKRALYLDNNFMGADYARKILAKL